MNRHRTVSDGRQRSSAAVSHDKRNVSPFTFRAVLLGVAGVAFYAWLTPFSVYRLFSSRVEQGVLSPGVLIAFLPILAANIALRVRFKGAGLRTGEMAVIFSMLWIGAASFQIGMSGNMLSVMSAPEYFASAENRWAEYYLAYIPAWAIPSDLYGGIRRFYNGLPLGESIPWEIWRIPFIWWGSIIAATLVVVICLMTIVHEQWHDHEKLQFPMADIPLMLIGRDARNRRFSEWLASPVFWTGFGLPFLIIAWNILHWFNPLFPHIAFSQDETGLAFRYLRDLYTKVDFFTIGLAYFAPVDVLRGLWVGRVFIGAEMAAGNKFGFANGMNPGFEPWSDWGTQTAAWQCLGSLVMFVLWGFYVGREHFLRVLKAAVGQGNGLSETLRRRYAYAVWGLLGALVYIAFFFNKMGMTWPVILLLLPMILLLTLGIGKVTVESSFLFVDSPVSSQTFVMQTLGTAHIPQASMTALVLSYVVFRWNSGLMMPQVAYSNRLGDTHGVPRGKLYGALGIAVFTAIVVATVTTVVLAYNVGAFNFQSHAFTKGHIEAYETLRTKSDEAFGPDWYRLGFFGFGIALMAAVLAIRMRFINFWLHPVGLTFATTSVVGLQTLNIFLAWAAKATLNRLGGNKLVNRLRPLFLGFLCGHSLGVALGIAVDAIWFPGHGHRILTGW